MLTALLLLACTPTTCEPVIGCEERVEVLRTGESWACRGEDRNDNGVDDCWDYAARETCP